MNDFLFSPTKQFLFPSGKILAGGKIYVFIKHTDNLATLYNDEDVEIANPIILDSNGRATVKADDTYDYKLDVYSPYDELLFTATSYLTDNFERDFAITSTDGSVDVNVSIDGYTTNWDLSVYNSIKGSTSGKLDTSAFESFYNDTYGPTVGDIYERIDDISATISGGYDGKLDVTAFNLYSAGIRGDLNVITGNTAALSNNTAMLSDEIIQNMNDINAVSGGLNTLNTIVIPEIRTDIIDVSGKLDTVSSSITNKLDTSSFNDFISNSYSPNMSTIYQGLGNLSANKEDKITWSYNNDGEISAANGSALAGKGYYSKYAPYGIQATSGNLIIEGSRYPRQSLLEVSGENKVATAGIIPPVPEQNLSAVRYLVAASGSLADVEWKELPQIDTFTGVTTDSTLTGDGKTNPLGVAEVQSLTSDNTINITSANNEVILGVNGTWFNDAVNSAVTGAQGDVEVNTYVHNNSATIDVVNTTVQSDSGKWDDTYTNYSNNSASYLTDASQFYPMNSNPSGYLTEETDWTNTIKEASANAFNEATALIPPAFDPTYISGVIDNKLDTTAFSDVSGTFLTAHQSLDGYATTAWVDSQGYLTAHQPISADEWNNVYDTVNVYSGSWTGSESSPTASVDSHGSIDIVSSNNTVYFDVNGTWFNDAVNSAVDVPTGVMVESACEYNAVNEISGYNGSAIAQYGAEKQWLVHDDTLVHASNSAQYALGVNLSAVEKLTTIDLQPKVGEETFAGYWNDHPVYQSIITMQFSSNGTTTAAIPSALYLSAVELGRRWIDVGQSWIHYGSESISLPITWFLGAGRQGCVSLISNSLSYRGVDNSNTACTAYICLKYRKKQA